ncbi:MAG: hypothetical protein WA937_05595 [Flavobacteriales bacterium]
MELEEIVQAAKAGNAKYGERKWVLCPTSEYLNIVLFEMREQLEQDGISIATCEKALYHTLSNKASFRTYCEELGIQPPKLFSSEEERTVTPPFVAKPKNNLAKNGSILYPHLIRTAEEQHSFLHNADRDEFYLEEFVHGESWYLLYYFSADGSVISGAQRNYLQQGKGKSIVLARAEDYPEESVPYLFKERLRRDGYRGFIMIELRRSASGMATAIEANPRCWGPFQLTIDARMGLLEAFLKDHGTNAVTASTGKRRATYSWLGGCLQAMRTGRSLDRHTDRSTLLGMIPSALANDVYARRGTWRCFLSDLWRRAS